MITQEQLDLEKRLSEITGKVVCYKTSLAQPKEKEYHKIENVQAGIFRSVYEDWGYSKVHYETEWVTDRGKVVIDIVNPDKLPLEYFNKYIETECTLECSWVKPGVDILNKCLMGIGVELSHAVYTRADSKYVDAIKSYLFHYGEENAMLRFGLLPLEYLLYVAKANLKLVDFIKATRENKLSFL